MKNHHQNLLGITVIYQLNMYCTVNMCY